MALKRWNGTAWVTVDALPSNAVTTDTAQTLTGVKTFSQPLVLARASARTAVDLAPHYRYRMAGETTWFTIATVTCATGAPSYMSLRADVDGFSTGNNPPFNNHNSIQINVVRSMGSQDDWAAAFIYGLSCTNIRVVKVNAGSYEIQASAVTADQFGMIDLRVVQASNATIAWNDPPAAPSAGTVYTIQNSGYPVAVGEDFYVQNGVVAGSLQVDSVSGQTEVSAPHVTAVGNIGIGGPLNQARLMGGTAAAPPVTGTYFTGDYIVTYSGDVFICTNGGTPGTWQRAGSTQVEVFTTNGSYYVPVGATSVDVFCVGSGGSGGAGALTATGTVAGGGGGGTGSNATFGQFRAADLTSPVTVTVAAAPAGANGQTSASSAGAGGSAGGTSTFGSYLRASGGAPGGGGTTSGAGAAGAGQSNGGTYLGGQGAAGSSGTAAAGSGSNSNMAGAGGGGGGGLSTANAAQNAGTGGFVGAVDTAGAAANVAGTSHAATLQPGGGGGGGSASVAGAGSAGKAGGAYGGGGGGGGAARNGQTSGGGGAGGAGVVVVVTHF